MVRQWGLPISMPGPRTSGQDQTLREEGGITARRDISIFLRRLGRRSLTLTRRNVLFYTTGYPRP